MAQTSDTLQTYADVEHAMLQVVHQAFYEGRFLRHLQAGLYTPRQVRHFALQYSYYSRHFPRVLGAAIAAMAPVAAWWVPLADNLWDEAGRGQPGQSHEHLYLTFLRSVDPHVELDDVGMPREPMSPAVAEAVQTFLDFFHRATPLQAMAAVGLGSELFAGGVMGAIGRGLKHPAYNRDRSVNVLFWELHADTHEPRHYQLCKDILQQFTQPHELRDMFETGRFIALSEARMYEQLHDEMVTLR
ncbi:MAG: iron-containing redox enzyme family protein [Alicyclobacillus sp.]|nr:iron-containing redox enzyme family protein [Alicyclobacillus sp.]